MTMGVPCNLTLAQDLRHLRCNNRQTPLRVAMAKRLPQAPLTALTQSVMRRVRSGSGPAQGLFGGRSSEAITQWLLDVSLSGFGPLESAEALAKRYRNNPKLKNDASRIEAMVRGEASKSFTTGFLTSLPVPLTLPAMLPISLVATWVIQARMVAAMAILSGHDPKSMWVRTTVLLALDDARTPQALKEAGLNPGQWAALGMAQHLGQPLMQNLWRKAGEALLARATRRGWMRVGRAVPVLGAIVAGSLDAYGCRQVALRSRSLIVPPDRTLA
jgi:hypothetical protein